MQQNKLIEQLGELVFQKLVQDRTVMIEQVNQNGGSGYSVYYKEINVLSEICKNVFNHLLTLNKEFIERTKTDLQGEVKKSIDNYFSKEETRTLIHQEFKRKVGETVDYNSYGKNNRPLVKEIFENEYSIGWGSTLEHKIKRRAQEIVEKDVNEFIEKNKDKIDNYVKEGNKVEISLSVNKKITL